MTDSLGERWPGPLARLIDAVCDRFEAAWRAAGPAGPAPRLEGFLAEAAPDDAGELLGELLPLELHFRLGRGERPTAREYAARFPTHAALVGRLFGAAGLPAPPRLHDRDTFGVSAATPAAGPDSQSMPTVGENGAPRPVPPVVVPGYEVLEELGRGGMGVVYKARQKALNRVVALKMILAGAHSTPAARLRFLAEAEAIARLHHPHIVQVHESGTAGGQPFFSLEYCDGGSLADRLADGPLPPADAAGLLLLLADAVQAAHSRGVIHRDLKPSNVLFQTPPGPPGGGVPKIADFGLAKISDAGLTATEAVLGTPGYMAPEQTCDARSADARADVYALGAILYACLTGRPPFQAPTLFETLEAVRTREPAPPSRLTKAVPRDLETICLKCLQKEPARRYATAHALAEDLRRFLDGRPIEGRPVGAAERAVRWVRRHRALAGLYAVSALAAAVLGGLGLWFSARLGTADARQRAERAERAAAEAEARAAADRAATQRFFALLNRARERSARPRPGWSWAALDDLAEAARLPDAAAHAAELREEAALALGAADARPAGVLAPGVTAYSVAWSPDGRRVALGGGGAGRWFDSFVLLVDPDRPDRTVKLCLPPSVARGQSSLLAPDSVGALAFSPDGRWLAAGLRGGAVYRWDLSRPGGQEAALPALPAEVAALAFAADGSALYGVAGRAVKRWSMADGWETAAEVPTPATGLAVHPGEGWVAVTADRVTHFLDGATLRPVRPAAAVGGLHPGITPDGDSLMVAQDGSFDFWCLRAGRPARALRGPDGAPAYTTWLGSVVLSPDGALLLAAEEAAKRVKLWDLAGGRLVADLFLEGGTGKAAFAPDGRRFVVTGDRETRLYAVGGADCRTTVAVGACPVNALALSPCDGSLACLRPSGPGRYEAAVWRPGALAGPPAARRDYEGDLPSWPQPLAFGGPWLGHSHERGFVLHLWDTTGRAKPHTFPGEGGQHLSSGPDGRLWICGSQYAAAWDAPAGRLVASYENRLAEVLTGRPGIRAAAAGRRWAVTVGQDGTLRVLPPGDGELRPSAVIRVSDAPLRRAVLLGDEGLAAVGTDRGEVALVRLPDGGVTFRAEAHQGQVSALAASGRLVASAADDGVVRLWAVEGDGLRELLSLRQAAAVRGLALGPDGVTLAVLRDGERGVRLWRLDRLRGRLAALGLGDGLGAIPEAPR
jgi:WD40 repeat protein